jgi:hypothetical protein
MCCRQRFIFFSVLSLSLHSISSAATAGNNKRLANGTSTDAQALIDNALRVLAVVNKDRVENPVFNHYEQEAPAQEYKPADFLDYTADPDSLAASKNVRRNETDREPRSYRIPEELAHAAVVVAESTAQEPQGDHERVAADIRKKYHHDFLNDTNIPHELQAPEGGLSVYAGDHNDPEARASGYWLIDDQKHPGKSPFSPANYKVWRNVKDYGAKGDGRTDDTAAINKAISDGARCGEECKTSTIAPAVVYFPPGTYLVSSSIIQYYNTQFLGDVSVLYMAFKRNLALLTFATSQPINVPTILAASSFVGLGVFTSNKYIDDNVGWYLNTANFLRSIKNFKMDIRLTDPLAYICAIHWQVAQASSLENIEFYMQYNSDNPQNTQQGIYMENGSGGFLADLTFVGGNFGAYFGNQQFTTSHLIFVNAKSALQVHWDWAWTMQDFVIEGCENGLVVTGGAGGEHSTGQSLGSLILTDTIIANTPNAIVTSLHAENSTSFLLQNVGFFNVKTAVTDVLQKKTLLAGGDEVYVSSWGFGRITGQDGAGTFVNGEHIPAMNRSKELTGVQYDKMKANLFTRRRPKYYDVPATKVMNVKALGAKGDGLTDDSAVLNSILAGAANTSSVVYFPFGVYIVKDTLRVPMGSRIIGQAWAQIMGTGSNFNDEIKPRSVVQVGRPQDHPGIIEIQDMMFTVSGPTSGAILLEWNAKESSKGSVGMWGKSRLSLQCFSITSMVEPKTDKVPREDTHFRVGGAIGSNLQKGNCPKNTGQVNSKCKAASMLMHLKPGSTAYLENVWGWVADHDLDQPNRDQIDIYVARGLLVESKKAWLWATSFEHCVFYQYQISSATNVVMGMIQTESPYFQPVPKAPQPYRTGLFPNDPTFNDCKSGDTRCYSSWALRIIDSSSVYILGAGLYSWFFDYSQKCLATNDCQKRAVEIQQSSDLWIYNLCTKAILEMVTPYGGVATFAKDNINGFLSSILAWLDGSEDMTGRRDFEGFQLYSISGLRRQKIPETCKTALSAKIFCDPFMRTFQEPGYRGAVENTTLADSVCDKGCGDSLKSWYSNVMVACNDYNITGHVATLYGGRIWAGYNETCLTDSKSGLYCNGMCQDPASVSCQGN